MLYVVIDNLRKSDTLLTIISEVIPTKRSSKFQKITNFRIYCLTKMLYNLLKSEYAY